MSSLTDENDTVSFWSGEAVSLIASIMAKPVVNCALHVTKLSAMVSTLRKLYPDGAIVGQAATVALTS